MRSIATRRFFSVAIALLGCAAIPQFAQATKVQGFESGDPAVTSIGDAGARGAFQGEAPPEGSMQFLLTTIGMLGNEDGLGSQSGVFAVGNATLQNFFHSLSIGGQEGSGVLIPFTISAGDTALTFQYDFLSNEPFQSLPRGDFAFAAIFNGANALQGSANQFANALTSNLSPFDVSNQAPFVFHTGYRTLSLSLVGLAPGNYTLGIGVADAVTVDHASGVLLDNVQIVPEASSVVLAIIGAILLLGFRRRIRSA